MTQKIYIMRACSVFSLKSAEQYCFLLKSNVNERMQDNFRFQQPQDCRGIALSSESA